MAKFSEIKDNLNISQIEEMESYVGLKFPIEYKEHLLKNNGGRCSPDVFSFIENGKTTDSSVNWFFAIHTGEYSNLKDYIDIFKINAKRMPSYILPIANDSLGNLICISCGVRDFGNVYFWNHEKEVDYRTSNDADYSNLYLISKNFNDFINGLKEDFN